MFIHQTLVVVLWTLSLRILVGVASCDDFFAFFEGVTTSVVCLLFPVVLVFVSLEMLVANSCVCTRAMVEMFFVASKVSRLQVHLSRMFRI